jgi:hypothetical protein
LAQLHGWTVRLDEGYEAGIKIVVAGSGVGGSPVVSTPAASAAGQLTADPQSARSADATADRSSSDQATSDATPGREGQSVVDAVVPDGLWQQARGQSSDD